MKKRLLIIMLIMICGLLLVLNGCSNTAESNPSKAISQSAVEETNEEPDANKQEKAVATATVKPASSASANSEKPTNNEIKGKNTEIQNNEETAPKSNTESEKITSNKRNEQSSANKGTTGEVSNTQTGVTEIPQAPTPTPAPVETEPEKPVSKGNAKTIGSGYCQSVLDAINAIRTGQGYAPASWNGDLAGKAQSWATSLINESIASNTYTHYHDNNRDSSEGIFWYDDPATLADQIAFHCPEAITNTDSIGIGGAIWENCPIGDDLGFIVIRYHS